MDGNQVIQYIIHFINSAGGVSLLIMTIPSFFATLWAKYFIEQEKTRLNQTLEQVKSNYRRELELYKATVNISIAKLERYNSRQFEIYSATWASIYDLEVVANNLWEQASKDNLGDFRKQLEQTIMTVHRNSLFIQDDHYTKLNNLLNAFRQFQIGKGKLIAMRSNQEFDSFYDPEIVQDQIKCNRTYKEQYAALVNLMRKVLCRFTD